MISLLSIITPYGTLSTQGLSFPVSSSTLSDLLSTWTALLILLHLPWFFFGPLITCWQVCTQRIQYRNNVKQHYKLITMKTSVHQEVRPPEAKANQYHEINLIFRLLKEEGYLTPTCTSTRRQSRQKYWLKASLKPERNRKQPWLTIRWIVV